MLMTFSNYKNPPSNGISSMLCTTVDTSRYHKQFMNDVTLLAIITVTYRILMFMLLLFIYFQIHNKIRYFT